MANLLWGTMQCAGGTVFSAQIVYICASKSTIKTDPFRCQMDLIPKVRQQLTADIYTSL